MSLFGLVGCSDAPSVRAPGAAGVDLGGGFDSLLMGAAMDKAASGASVEDATSASGHRNRMRIGKPLTLD